MNKIFKVVILSAATASMLAACGGGDDPDPTDLNTTLTVTSATDSTANGVYGSTATGLSDVQRIERIGSTDGCEFTFNSVRKVGDSNVEVTGRIRYLKEETLLNQLSISIGGVGYSTEIGANTVVDRSANRIRFVNKEIGSTAADANTIRLDGSIPMRSDRPSGC